MVLVVSNVHTVRVCDSSKGREVASKHQERGPNCRPGKMGCAGSSNVKDEGRTVEHVDYVCMFTTLSVQQLASNVYIQSVRNLFSPYHFCTLMCAINEDTNFKT